METRTKYLFITGGVLSGVGKGVVAASIGALLRARGYKVLMQKLDPYLNQDPGTMSPYQHGEVYVTKDSKETDLDLGHYERFVGEECVSESNYTTGAIYKEIFRKERKGEYKGQTVQVIPHVLEAITRKVERASMKYKPDFMLIEVGGTVGDIESQPFVYAIASFAKKHKRTFFIHTTYVPYLSVTSEHKTKPTQHSVQLLRSYGVQPTAIIVRSPKKLLAKTKVKIAQYTSLEKDAVVDLPDVKSIYIIPLLLEETKIVHLIEKYFLIKNPVIPNLTS